MTAATDLLVEGGPDALTVDGVVERSGVAKSTIYRHWSTRDELVAQVFQSCAPNLTAPEDLRFEDSLRSLMRSMVATLGDEKWRRLLPALLQLQVQHPELRELNSEVNQDQSDSMAEVLRLGVKEGVLPQSAVDDIQRSMTLLMGPLLMAALFEKVPLDDRIADDALAQFMASVSARAVD
ncbi:MAG: TetR/AcrR family transcriptional regulator [Microthrixaceae bacterium]